MELGDLLKFSIFTIMEFIVAILAIMELGDLQNNPLTFTRLGFRVAILAIMELGDLLNHPIPL